MAPEVIPPPFDLGRGINLGNKLEAPSEGDWGSPVRAWTDLDSASVQTDFDTVAEWASQHNITVFLGEFGAYSTAATNDRVAGR
jgi:hypothetical protein